MRSSWRWVAAVAVLAVVAVLIAGRPSSRQDGDPYDPDGTGSNGTKALVLLLEELGAEVRVEEGVPDASVDAAILFEDALGGDRAEQLVEWARAGATLVVADPASTLTPVVTGPVEDDEVAPEDCDVELLGDVAALAAPGASRFEVPEGARSCFGDGRQAVVVEEGVGDGRVVAVGSPQPFTNGHLDEADNAVLAARLLVADGEGATVAVLVPDPTPAPTEDEREGRPGEGDETLLDLVPSRVWLALLQLALAFLVYVWFRARRVGRPVPEPRPTPLAGSDLVDAVGRLRAQEEAPDRSAAILREDLRRTLCRRLGVPQDTGVDDLVAVAEHAGVDGDRLRAALDSHAPTDDDLVALARTIDSTRQEVLHERH